MTEGSHDRRARPRPLGEEHMEMLTLMITELHRSHGNWRRTRDLVERRAPELIEVDEDSQEARYYGVRGKRLVRAIVADRVLVALAHPLFDGDEDHLAMLAWCAEWTRDASLQ